MLSDFDIERGVVLHIENLILRFGGITALDSVGFTVAPGEICGLIGPNGAGKTSLFNCVTRVYRPEEGIIRYRDTDLRGLRRDEIVKHGIARTFQNLSLWSGAPVLQNTLIGAHGVQTLKLVPSLHTLPGARRVSKQIEAKAW